MHKPFFLFFFIWLDLLTIFATTKLIFIFAERVFPEFELAQIALFCNQKKSWRNLVLGASAMAQIWCRRCATMDQQLQPKALKTLEQHNRPLVFDQEHPVLAKLIFKRTKSNDKMKLLAATVISAGMYLNF